MKMRTFAVILVMALIAWFALVGATAWLWSL